MKNSQDRAGSEKMQDADLGCYICGYFPKKRLAQTRKNKSRILLEIQKKADRNFNPSLPIDVKWSFPYMLALHLMR